MMAGRETSIWSRRQGRGVTTEVVEILLMRLSLSTSLMTDSACFLLEP